jgi:diadenosine tetraphosphatase ApaH/serine/threonine PP2A family protein phosphatase
MRYLVLTDIHANIDALESVLADAERHAPYHVLVLGDLVGYGADPNAVLARLMALSPLTGVRGNHDRAALNLAESEGFNVAARVGARWTASALSAESRSFLRALPQGPIAIDPLVEICHGTPFDEDAYVFDEMDALYSLRASSRPLCLYGHTHKTFVLAFDGTTLETPTLEPGRALALREQVRYLVNVGSVGQPRDGDPRAAYGVIDVERREVCAYRVVYPVDRAMARIIDAGLPESMARRLELGR